MVGANRRKQSATVVLAETGNKNKNGESKHMACGGDTLPPLR